MVAKCREIMTPDPACCLATDTIQRAAQIMRDEDVGPVPVVSDHQRKGLIGIVTDRDIVIQAVAGGRDLTRTTVAEVMSSDVVTCRPDEDINHAMRLMSQHQIRRIPVIDENNQLIGIIAQADVARRLEMPGKVAEVVENISQPNRPEQLP